MKKSVAFCLISIIIALIVFAWCSSDCLGESEFNSEAFRENIGFTLRGEVIYAVAGVRLEIFGDRPVPFRTPVKMSPEDMLQRGPDHPEVAKVIEDACVILEEAIKRCFPGASVDILSPKDGSWISLGTIGRTISF